MRAGSATAAMVSSLLLASAAVAGTPAAACPTVPVVDDRCELWTASYDDPEGYGVYGEDLARAVTTSSDGATVFVTGASRGRNVGLQLWVGAYGATDGTQRWVRRSDVGGDDVPTAIVTRGDRVYVVGSSSGDFLAAAYRATGEVLWTRAFDGPSQLNDGFSDVVLSPDGETLYAAGVEGYDSSVTRGDAATIALDADDGSTVWSSFYDGPASRFDSAASVHASADGRTVFVAGRARVAGSTPDDVLALAIEAEDQERLGEVIWATRFDGGAGNDLGVDSVLAPAGDRLYVVGSSRGGPGALFSNNMDILTLAVRTSDGAVAWTKRLEGPDRADDFGTAIAIAPDGSRVFTLGSISDQTTNTDSIVAAYATGDGAQVWTRRYNGAGYTADRPVGIVVSPDGTKLFAAARSFLPRASGGVQGMGVSTDHGTIATFSLETGSGNPRWTARHGSLVEANVDEPNAIAIDPAGQRVFVAATYGYRVEAQLEGNYHDLATLAYLT